LLLREHKGLIHSHCFHRRRHRISLENGVNPHEDISWDIQKMTFVFDRGKCAPRAVVHAYLEGLCEGFDCVDIALYAQVSQDEEGG
jgi:hypothetical protein